MKTITALTTILFAACAPAAELTTNLLRLISADTRMVTGADFDRQAGSVLNQFLRSGLASNAETEGYKAVWIDCRTPDTSGGSSLLTAFIGPISLRDSAGDAEQFTRLDPSTQLAGNPDLVRQAQLRLTMDKPLSPLAVKARRLSQSYDNWFVLRKPFALAPTPAKVPGLAAPPLKYRQDLLEAVEEISGGIRFGPSSELYLEAVFRNPEDSWAVATLARWLPGFLQLDPNPQPQSILVDAIEDLNIHADGERVTISLRIPEDKARALLEAHRAQPVVQ